MNSKRVWMLWLEITVKTYSRVLGFTNQKHIARQYPEYFEEEKKV